LFATTLLQEAQIEVEWKRHHVIWKSSESLWQEADRWNDVGSFPITDGCSSRVTFLEK